MRRTLFSIFLLSFAQIVWGVDYNDPVGIWDIEGKAILHARFSGLNLASRRVVLSDSVQFHEDGSFTSRLLSTVTDGRWRAGKKNGYRIRYDADQIRNAPIPDLLYQVASQFTELAGTNFRTIFSIQDIRIGSYTDRGALKKGGTAIKGTVRVRADVDFTVPKGKKPVKARIDFNIRYSGERASAPSICCSSDDPAQNLADSRAFLNENAALPRVQQTASGLQYRIIDEGAGASPGPASTVTVNYRGTLPSGKGFDANSNVSFALNRVIAGWTEGLQLMREGAYYRFYIPPELAYGEFGAGSLIKPNSALIFDVQLTKVGG